MAFPALGGPPGRDKVCDDVKSLLLKAFPATELDTHFRGGYTFRSDACTTAFAYDPDYCVAPADVKMDPEGFGPEKAATLGMIQSAFNCSPVGETLETLTQIARDTIENNLWRAIEADLVADLAAFPDIVVGGTLEATCALADAAQFLATNGNCGKGIIVGPYDWFIQLGTDHLVWNGVYHTDVVGNIVIPLSVDNNTVYAFDSNVDIRVAPILVLDELAPSIRSVNDRIVRAEQIYTVATDPCVVGSFTVSACCDCGGGGGGGGGVQNPCNCQFQVTNFPANQNVTVTNTPLDVTLDEPIDVNVLNFPASTFSSSVDDELLCDDNGPFFRRVVDDGEGNLTVSNVDLAGAPYVPVGTVKVCGSAPLTLGENCVTAPDPGAPPIVYNDTFGSLNGGAQAGPVYVYPNWDGSGVDVTVTVVAAIQLADKLQFNTNGTQAINVAFTAPVTLTGVTLGELDGQGAESFNNFSVPHTGTSGFVIEGPANVFRSTILNGNPDGDVVFNVSTNGFTFNHSGNGLGTWLHGMTFTLPDLTPVTQRVISVKCDGCEDGVAYFNKETGLEVTNPVFNDCPPEAVTLDEPIDVNVLNFPVTTPITLNSYHRLVADADPAWTPAEVVGTLTSVTYSILSGTATVTDSAGAVAAGLPAGLSSTWEITPDSASLNGPLSIDAIGGTTYVVWTAF